ncbi:hypothetical protein [Formosa algae]|uniref:hypothetical protein n=1 Tax=Formosa algae TaxID=225843 RepID=UPI000CCE2DEF|nr:hypothetical protein [Formosa algae]PNW28932.1 hypothetical protein BKP44_06740 [Formosa algae]
MNFSIYFNLLERQPELGFVDIKLDRDNLLSIDPRLIELSDSPIAKEMQKRIDLFWAQLIIAIRAKDNRRINSLLSGLSEPHETRFGYSFSKYGNSVGEKLKPKIVHAILSNPAVRSGVLSHFSDVDLCIEDVSGDRISDITTKIIKEVLIEYTQAECRKLGVLLQEVKQRDIFDLNTSKWYSKNVLLPVHNGKPILLVPKDLVRGCGFVKNNLACLYRFAIRNFISNDPEMLVDVSPSGVDGEIMLKDIKEKYPLCKQSITAWIIRYGKLLVDFKSKQIEDGIFSMTDSDIMEIVYREDLAKVS